MILHFDQLYLLMTLFRLFSNCTSE